MKRVLITGSNGFVGSALLNLLKDDPRYDLVTVDRKNSNFNGDLTQEQFIRSLPDVDVVIHLAAAQYLTRTRRRLQLRAFFNKNNFEVTKYLSDRYLSCEQFIFIGTSMMYKMQSGEVEENDKNFCEENGPYANSKVASYKYLKDAKTQRTLTTLIPTIICGRGRGGFFSTLNKLINSFHIYPVVRSREIETGVVHVDDFCNLIHRVLTNAEAGIFNAQTAKGSFDDWAMIIAKKRHIKMPINKGLIKLLNRCLLNQVFSKEQELLLFNSHHLSVKNSNKIGWQAKHTLTEAVTDSIKQK